MSDLLPTPAGPKLPAPLQAAGLIGRPTEFLDNCRARYGNAFTLNLPFNDPLIIVSDPDAIHEIFTGSPDDLHAGEGNRILKPIVGPRSLLLLDGREHKRDRKIMLPPFHGERMRSYADSMLAITTQFIDQWPIDRTFPVHGQMQALTLEIILTTVFGVEDAQQLAEFRDAMNALLEFGDKTWFLFLVDSTGEIRGQSMHLKLGNLSPLTRFLAAGERVDRLIFAEINRRRQSDLSARDDVLSLLLQATDEDGNPLSDNDLRDELMTLLLAGHETTATALSWLTWRLTAYPGATMEMRDEVAGLGKGGPVPTDRLNELNYVTAAIKESMRLMPVIPFVVRKLKKPMTIGGMDLPEGVIVAPSIYLTHHRPDLWPDPERFRPERFLEKGAARPNQFFPFGGGNRTCLGMSFAYQEMKIVAAELVRRVRYDAAPGYRPKVVRRNITFAPSRGVPIRVRSISA